MLEALTAETSHEMVMELVTRRQLTERFNKELEQTWGKGSNKGRGGRATGSGGVEITAAAAIARTLLQLCIRVSPQIGKTGEALSHKIRGCFTKVLVAGGAEQRCGQALAGPLERGIAAERRRRRSEQALDERGQGGPGGRVRARTQNRRTQWPPALLGGACGEEVARVRRMKGRRSSSKVVDSLLVQASCMVAGGVRGSCLARRSLHSVGTA